MRRHYILILSLCLLSACSSGKDLAGKTWDTVSFWDNEPKKDVNIKIKKDGQVVAETNPEQEQTAADENTIVDASNPIIDPSADAPTETEAKVAPETDPELDKAFAAEEAMQEQMAGVDDTQDDPAELAIVGTAEPDATAEATMKEAASDTNLAMMETTDAEAMAATAPQEPIEAVPAEAEQPAEAAAPQTAPTPAPAAQPQNIENLETVVGTLPNECPKIVMNPTTRSITYLGKENKSAIVARASMSEIRGGCEYVGNTVELDLDLIMKGYIGPQGRYEGRRDLEAFMTFPYFIAITDPQGQPVDKKILATAMRFWPEIDDLDHAEKITHKVPLAQPELGNQYTISIGFQLNREQLAYNQANTLRNPDAPKTPDLTRQASPTPTTASATSSATASTFTKQAPTPSTAKRTGISRPIIDEPVKTEPKPEPTAADPDVSSSPVENVDSESLSE